MNPTSGKPVRKTKKSFTLSPDSIAFLEATRKTRQAESVSSVLEEIVQKARGEQERLSIERRVDAYYASLTDNERIDEAQWGEFSLKEFPGAERA